MWRTVNTPHGGSSYKWMTLFHFIHSDSVKNFLSLSMLVKYCSWYLYSTRVSTVVSEYNHKAELVHLIDLFIVPQCGWVFWGRLYTLVYSKDSHWPRGMWVYIWGKLLPQAREKWHLFCFWILSGEYKWTVMDICRWPNNILQDQTKTRTAQVTVLKWVCTYLFCNFEILWVWKLWVTFPLETVLKNGWIFDSKALVGASWCPARKWF